MRVSHRIDSVRFRGRRLFLVVDDTEYSFDLENISPKLMRAEKKDRETFRISPSGYGIHWPLLDEDLSIESLVKSAAQEAAPARRP
jgi:hypothetical protein